MNKIVASNPVVELDGDEMTRIIWKRSKTNSSALIFELDVKYFDLGLEHREATKDQVTVEAAEAIKAHNVGIKYATITPDLGRMDEFKLSKMWKSLMVRFVIY